VEKLAPSTDNVKALEPAFTDDGEIVVIRGAANASSEVKKMTNTMADTDEGLKLDNKRVTRHLESEFSSQSN
jgi:hypothetical protein